MGDALDKEVLTTGEVARICHVAPRTVSKWFDSGRLRGYRIPGSRDRRIPRRQLVAFMRAHGLPLQDVDDMEDRRCRVLIVDPGPPDGLVQAMNASDRYDVRLAANGFEAGLTAQEFRPHVIVLDAEGDPEEAAAICRNVKAAATLESVRVIAVGGRPDQMAAVGDVFDERLPRPYSLAELVRVVERTTDLIVS